MTRDQVRDSIKRRVERERDRRRLTLAERRTLAREHAALLEQLGADRELVERWKRAAGVRARKARRRDQVAAEQLQLRIDDGSS